MNSPLDHNCGFDALKKTVPVSACLDAAELQESFLSSFDPTYLALIKVFAYDVVYRPLNDSSCNFELSCLEICTIPIFPSGITVGSDFFLTWPFILAPLSGGETPNLSSELSHDAANFSRASCFFPSIDPILGFRGALAEQGATSFPDVPHHVHNVDSVFLMWKALRSQYEEGAVSIRDELRYLTRIRSESAALCFRARCRKGCSLRPKRCEYASVNRTSQTIAELFERIHNDEMRHLAIF